MLLLYISRENLHGVLLDTGCTCQSVVWLVLSWLRSLNSYDPSSDFRKSCLIKAIHVNLTLLN